MNDRFGIPIRNGGIAAVVLVAVYIITVISQYQVQLFWVGLAFNIAGILYMIQQVRKFSRRG